MKRKISRWAMLSIGALLSVGCSEKNLSVIPEAVSDREIVITVGMETEIPATRLVYKDDKLRLVWGNGDYIVAAGFDAGGNYLDLTEFRLTGGAGTSVGTFQGELLPAAVNYVVYFKNENLYLDQGLANPHYAHQKQTSGTLPADHLKRYMLIRSHAQDGSEWVSAADLASGNFSMRLVSSLLRFDITVPEALREEGLDQLVWTNNPGTIWARSVTLTFPPEGNAKTLTTFVCFEKMDLKPGHIFRVKVSSGAKSAVFEVVSEEGKEYLPGGRSVAVLKDGWVLSE